jgi:hypothetical protein
VKHGLVLKENSVQKHGFSKKIVYRNMGSQRKWSTETWVLKENSVQKHGFSKKIVYRNSRYLKGKY